MIATGILVQFCLVSAVLTYGLGVYVFSQDPASRSNRLFLASMFAGAYWAFGEFMIWQSAAYDNVLFWLKASAFWPLAIAFLFHFVLVYTGHPAVQKKKAVCLLLLLVYLPALVLSFAGLFTDLIFTVSFMPGTGYTYIPAAGSAVHMLEVVFILAVMTAALVAGIMAYARATDEKVRKQSGLITAAIFIVVLFGSLSGIILPSLAIYVPNLVFFGIVIFSVIIVYAIARYGLFTLTPETAVPDIIRILPDGLILSDMDDRIVTANAAAAAIFSENSGSMTGESVTRFIPQPVYRAIRSEAGARGVVTDFEVALEKPAKPFVRIAAALVRDPDGGPAGLILIVHDITGRKEQEKALRAANEKISLLNQLTRHDISNLVTGLSSYLTLLKMKNGDDESSAQYVDACIEIVGKISQHLRFSREYQEIGKHDPVWQPLTEIVDNAVADLVHPGVEIGIPPSPVEIFADPLAVKVMYNLFENSLRHGDHVTGIRISSQEQGDRALLIIVEDNGTGVPDADKERIFTRGFGKNTGLGLALSREILAVTGITIAENGTFGTGARFIIRIPPPAWRRAGQDPGSLPR
jgi:PAS domain S-box-containing protein